MGFSKSWIQPGKATKVMYPVQLFDLEKDLGETKNLAEKEPEKVKEIDDLFSKAIRDGRSSAGAKQENAGWPGPIPNEALG